MDAQKAPWRGAGGVGDVGFVEDHARTKLPMSQPSEVSSQGNAMGFMGTIISGVLGSS